MHLFRSERNPQRKFIDLIYKQTRKFANWDPPSEIEVGSYGTVDRDTGALRVEGNIYSPEFASRYPEGFDVSKYLPKLRPEEDEYMTWSSNVHKAEFNPSASLGVGDFAGASLKGTWETKRGRGAVLLMHKPCIREIPSGEIYGHLAKIQMLWDKCLVTRVFYCPAYALCLSSQKGEVVSIALHGSAPVASTGVVAEGGATLRWWSDNQAGLLRSGCHEEPCFTPLYDLMQAIVPERLPHKRGPPLPVFKDDNYWIPAGLPWEPLDEQGEEVPIINDWLWSDRRYQVGVFAEIPAHV